MRALNLPHPNLMNKILQEPLKGISLLLILAVTSSSNKEKAKASPNGKLSLTGLKEAAPPLLICLRKNPFTHLPGLKKLLLSKSSILLNLLSSRRLHSNNRSK